MRRLVSVTEDSRLVESSSRRKRHRSPSDVRREARRNAERQDEVRTARVDQFARTAMVNEFAAARLDRDQHGLDAEKLRLRSEVRDGLGTSEGASFDGRRP